MGESGRFRPTRRHPKPKVLLDESLPPRRMFSNLNRQFDVKHIASDLGLGGSSDEQVYKLASRESRLLVTFNIKDFRPMVSSTKISVIGVSTKLKEEDLDKKLVKRLKTLTPSELQGNFFTITN